MYSAVQENNVDVFTCKQSFKDFGFVFLWHINGFEWYTLVKEQFDLIFYKDSTYYLPFIFNHNKTPNSTWLISLPISQHLKGESVSTMTMICRNMRVFFFLVRLVKMLSLALSHKPTRSVGQVLHLSVKSPFLQSLSETFSHSAVTGIETGSLLESLTYKDNVWYQWLPSQASS